jgi:hypothetical protein
MVDGTWYTVINPGTDHAIVFEDFSARFYPTAGSRAYGEVLAALRAVNKKG